MRRKGHRSGSSRAYRPASVETEAPAGFLSVRKKPLFSGSGTETRRSGQGHQLVDGIGKNRERDQEMTACASVHGFSVNGSMIQPVHFADAAENQAEAADDKHNQEKSKQKDCCHDFQCPFFSKSNQDRETKHLPGSGILTRSEAGSSGRGIRGACVSFQNANSQS